MIQESNFSDAYGRPPRFDTVSNAMISPILFYDIETDSRFAAYAGLRLLGYQIGDAEPRQLDLDDPSEVQYFKEMYSSPEWLKVGYNNINFDDIVLYRHGFHVCPENRHDVFLMAKTINPLLPAYGLKFLSWYFYRDPHEPERRLHAWCNHNDRAMWQAPESLLRDYCLYDVTQTSRLFKLFWPIVQRPKHWAAYNSLELPMGEVIQQLTLDGQECLSLASIHDEISILRAQLVGLNVEACNLTEGVVPNLGSTQTVAKELKYIEDFELNTTDKGNLQLRKDELLTMLDLDDPQNDRSRLARLTYEYRGIIKQLGYLKSYRKSLLYSLRTCAARRVYRERGYGFIPKSFSLSTARTRRILSSSRFGINFQNQNYYSKRIQLVPPGWIGIWIDATQIENVVHMWASDDKERIRSYTGDPDWSEYVWLCNRILGGNRSRQELDGITSNANPTWSVYKQFKTCKLALNFGMGIAKFSRTNKIDTGRAKELFDQIHRACPAIKSLQRTIERELRTNGYVQDPWGHIYTGSPDIAYKVVAYFIQGCGTGSVPKAMARAIYDVLEEINTAFDTVSKHKVATLTTLIHDEIGFRIWAGLPTSTLIYTIRKCLYCMEGRFSHMFGGIPLRAKLKVSVTNAADATELNHYHLTPQQWDQSLIEYINQALILSNETNTLRRPQDYTQRYASV